MSLRDTLMTEIQTYLERPGVHLAETTFGRLAANDSMLLRRLRDGREITIGKVDDIRAFIAANPTYPPTKSERAA